jgi:hypothetical protein
MVNGLLIIVFIFPLECEIWMDDEIKIQIQCIDRAMLSLEG